MIKFENECVGCTDLGLPCKGDSCSNRRVPKTYCDECKEEFSPIELYVNDDDEMLCQTCLLERFETVAQVGLERW